MVTKARSPNYPAFGLAKAIDLIRKVHSSIHHHKAPPAVVVKTIGYSSMSGRALSSISALKKYGLLDEVGKEFKVSKDAMLILFEPADSAARSAALERAAMAPDLFAKLRSEFPGQLPSDDLLRSYLLQNGFLLTTVDQPIRAYRDTISMLSSGGAGYNPSSDAPDEELGADETDDGPPIEIGDLVQWESNGVLRMEKARPVRAIRDGWAFVEDSETGIPMDELILEQKRPGEVAKAQPPKLPLPAFATQMTDPMERELLRGTISKAQGITYRLMVTGELGSREIGKLIKLLEAQKAVLEDDMEEDPRSSSSALVQQS